VPRYVRDEYELPDDDELPDVGKIYRRRRSRLPGLLFALFALVVMGGAAAASYVYVNQRQESDAFCISCHTPQHSAYLKRAEAALGGALAADLSSFHYQQIRGSGGDIHCIDCHRGDNSPQDRIATMLLSARMAARWVVGSDNRALEKTVITTTVIGGITLTVPQTTLALHEGRLTNMSCIACHTQQMLVAGQANHMHNTLPAVYEVWKAGARLVPPKGATDPQAIVAQGLVRLDTTVECSSCHQTHRSIETANYLDMQAVVKPACERCHRQTGQGPADVVISTGQ